MFIEIDREDECSLPEYAGIAAAFDVRTALQPPTPGSVQRPLLTRTVRPGYRKDYDAIPGNHPREWAARFAVGRACWLAAYGDGARVGGAVVLVAQDDIERAGGEAGLALLWDLRVAAHARRLGVGRALLAAAERAARKAGLRGISVETQDINVAACEAYAAAGFVVARVERDAYPDFPEETRLIWTKTFVAVHHPADERGS